MSDPGTALPPVYLLTGEFPPRMGGIADYTARLAERLATLDLQITVLVGRDHPIEPGAVPDGVRIARLDVAFNGWSLLPAVARRLGEEPAILHIQYQTAAFGMHPAVNLLPRWLRWKRPQTRTIVTCHDVRVPYLFPKAGRLRAWVNRRMIDDCHAAIFSDVSDRRWAGAGPNHWLIPIGSGVPVAPPSPHVRPIDSTFRIGYFGFMNASKGMPTLLRALAALAAEGRPVCLVLIGDALGDADATNRHTQSEIESEIRRLGVAGRIERTGPLSLEGVSHALQACDALAFPFDDGASFRRSSLMAAFTHCRPVVTTLQESGEQGIPGFEHEESVLLVPPHAPDALAQALRALMDDSALRDRLEAGVRRASERIQWPRIAMATRDVYSAVAEPSVGAVPG